MTRNRSDRKAVAVTGMGICCAAGMDVASVWRTLNAHEAYCTPAARDFFAPHPASPLFTAPGDDMLSRRHRSVPAGLTQDEVEGINRTMALALAAAGEALAQAGLSLAALAGKRVGIALGTTVGCTFHNEPYYIDWKSGRPGDTRAVTTYLSANLAERLQALLRVQGPRAVVTNACASGTDAIGLAKRWLEHDLCDVAIAGGSDEISRIACHGFSSLMLFSRVPCRPFDQERAGLNLGEGAGLFVLEGEDEADARGIQPLGWVRGYGAASDAHHPTAPHPEGRGLQQAIVAACADAAVSLQDIGYINAHGTGTKANDQAELTALARLGIAPADCPVIVSSKGATGHTLGAAGGVEAVIALQALRERYSPGSTGCRQIDPTLPLPVLHQGEVKQIHGYLGISQSLAFGGGNSALVLEGMLS